MPERVPVTVVIATRDRCQELGRTLQRLRDLPERPSVIVVDNDSSDGTTNMVAAMFPEVTLLALPANRGATARNPGVRRAATPYVAFSDDDSWWEPGSLATAARVLDEHPRLGLLVARIRLGDGGDIDRVSRKMATAPLGRDPDLPGPSVLGFPACAAVVRRSAFLSVGGFDDLLFFGGEESLVALDMATAGWGLAYVPEVTAVHAPSKRRAAAPERWGLHRRNDLLISWMRLSYARAFRGTRLLAAQAVSDPVARRTLAGLVRRLPSALARRHRVPAVLERRLDSLHELR